MKKLMMLCIAAAMMIVPAAAFGRPVRVFVAPAYGWGGYSRFLGTLSLRIRLLRLRSCDGRGEVRHRRERRRSIH